MKQFTIEQGAVGMPGGVLEPLQCPLPAESVLDWAGKKVLQTFAQTPLTGLSLNRAPHQPTSMYLFFYYNIIDIP